MQQREGKKKTFYVENILPSMEESGDDNRARRRALRGADRERLLRYVASIVEHQNTPLRDIVRDRVLPRLPVQPLRRFRSVSRSWHAHLSSPFFAHTQSTAHRSLSGFFFFLLPHRLSYYLPLDPRASSIPDPAFSFLPDTVSVVASCNGLVACRSSIDPSRYYISNPATRDWTALPRTLPRHAAEGFAALVFRPAALGFSADYHLVCVCACPPRLGLHVFSSGLSAWHPSNATVPKAREPWSSVAVGGLACWPNRDGSVSSYDPVTDRLTVIMMPPAAVAAETAGRWQLAEMGGKLCCVVAKQGTVEVWSTTAAAAIGAGATWRRLASVGMAGEPRAMVSEGKEERAVVCVGDRVVAIDVESGEWRVVRDGPVTTEWDACMPYISSLVAVKEFCYGSGCYTCRLHSGSLGLD